MLETLPDTKHIIPENVLENLSAGMKMAIVARVSKSLSDQVLEPDQWYDNLARFRTADGVDWGTQWAEEAQTREPTAPENSHDTLPAVLQNWRQATRALDNTMLSLSLMAERAIRVDQETVLGIPAGIKKWKSGHGYIADRLGIETRQAGQYRDRAKLVRPEISTVGGVGHQPQLPLVAKAYRAGEIPPENLDTIVRSLNQVGKYLSAVNLSPENIRDVFKQLDESFRNAATTVKPAELAKLTDDILAQAAAIIDADGPPPQEILNKVENSFRYKIVNGKLEVRIITDILNLELFLGIMYAGLNFRAYKNRYHSPPSTNQPNGDKQPNAANKMSPTSKQSSLFDTEQQPTQVSQPQESPMDRSDGSEARLDQPGISDSSTDFLDEAMEGLPMNAPPEQILAAADQQLEDEIDGREIHAQTIDGEQLSKSQMDRLDPRSRAERLHDIYIAHLRATAKLDPSVQGLSIFGGAPTQLRIALDYQTFAEMLDERLQDTFHLPTEYRRPPGLEGFDSGPPRFLQGLELSPEHLIDASSDDGTTLVEIDVAKYSKGAGKIRIPKLQRGHPFISRTSHGGTIAPQHLRAALCDAEIIPQVLGSGNVILDRGRATRTYPNSVKRDLAAYGACSIPDCRIPAAYTDGHHLIWWSQGGTTSSQNVTLLCPKCHGLVHKGVWTPVFDANGQLYWKPAPWLEPTQTPVRNTYWG